MRGCRLRIIAITLWFRTALNSFRWEIAPGGRRLKEEPPKGRPDLYADLTALRFCRGEVQLVGHPGEVRQRSRVHLSHDLAAMDFYGDLADPDVVGNLLIEAARHDQ